jgi:ABC-2 type transport system permease protein
MDKLWAIAGYEYQRHVRRPSFLLSLLSVPVLVAIVIGISALVGALRPEQVQAVGYVDPSGTLPTVLPERAALGIGDNVTWVPFETEAAAQDALAAGKIAAYYRLPGDYPATRQGELVYAEEPDPAAARQLRQLLRAALVAGQPAAVAQRIVEGSTLVIRLPGAVPGGPREFRSAPTAGQLLPALAGLVLMLLTFVSSGYLMGAVSDEKANRTMEILLTSASTFELMAGKVLGIIGVALTQLVAWVGLSALFLVVGRAALDVAWLQDLRPDPAALAIALAVAVPSYVLLGGLMAALGALLDEAQGSQQVALVATVLYMTPLILIVPMMRALNAPVVVVLSIVPFTAPVVLPLRAAFAVVPSWQVLASVIVQVLCATGAVWLAGRALQLGALRYGRRVRWRELLGGSPPQAVETDTRSRAMTLAITARAQASENGRRRSIAAKTFTILGHELSTILVEPIYLLVCVGIPLLVFGQLWLMTAAAGGAGAARAPSGAVEPGGAVAAMPQVQGYVDRSGLIRILPAQIPDGTLIPFADEGSAQEALARGEIDGYYIIGTDYLASGRLVLVQPAYDPLAATSAGSAMEWALLVNLLDGDQALAVAVRDPLQVQAVAWEPGPAAGQEEEVSSEEAGLIRLIPMLVMLLVYGSILMGSGLLLRSVSEEKKSRVIEILLVSVHPRQLLTGKILGLGIAGLLQAAIWTGLGYLLLRLLGGPVALPTGLNLSPGAIAWIAAFMVLGYLVYATLYAGAGALVPDWRKARSASLLIAVPAFVGFEIGLLTTDNPNGLLAVVTSLFPLTAPMIMVKRLVVGGVPAWQLWVAAGAMVLTIPLVVRAVARMFQAQYLLSGEPFSARRYFRMLLGRSRT